MLSDERASPSDADGLSHTDSLRPGARGEKRVEHPPSDEQVVSSISPRIEELLSNVATAAPVAIFVKDLVGRYCFVNPAGAALLQLPEGVIIGRTDYDLFAPDFADRQSELERRIVSEGATLSMESDFASASGQRAYHIVKSPFRDSAGQIVGIVSVKHDITETRHLEAQLRHAQKMDAVGHLAGSVSHDFNNVLTAVRGFAELLHASMDAADPRSEDALEIVKAADRGREITRQLLTFSRRQELRATLLGADALIDDLLPLLARVAGANIQVSREGGSALRLRADRGLLEQVIVNLVANARDATLAREIGGAVVIGTGSRTLTTVTALTSGALGPGQYCVVWVADRGIGMTDETRAHIFEPFYTTKAAGHGTGLGLSTSYGIITQAGGAIDVETTPGQGTTMTVLLPTVGAHPGRDREK